MTRAPVSPALAPPAPIGPERARVLALLKRWGAHATSFQILEPSFHYWFSDEHDAVVAYVDAGAWRVAAGPPIAPPDAIGAVAARFVARNLGERHKTAFFGVEQDFLDAIATCDPPLPHDAVPIGEQADFDAPAWGLGGARRRSLRAQVNRAANHGVTVRRVEPAELSTSFGRTRAEVERVLQRWLATRRMSIMRFLVDLHPFVCAEERRFYLAERHGQAVGFLAAVPVYARRGWFLEDVIRAPDAPNGTVEALIHTAIDDTRGAGDAFATLGMCPLAGIPDGPGPHRALRGLLRLSFRRLGGLYGFATLRTFKGRFRPDAWTPQLLVASPPPIGAGAIHAVLRAFAGGGLLSFGMDTARRVVSSIRRPVWAALLAVLAALLVPWTVMIALADGPRWFGDPSIQAAWVAFDAAMVCAFGGLSWAVSRGHRASLPIATGLLGAAATDALLTTVQALHLHTSASGATAWIVAAGISGPVLATALLVLLITALSAPR